MRCAAPRPISSTPMLAGTPVRASWRAAFGAALARRSAPPSGSRTCAGLPSLPTAELIELLNRYFDCQIPAIAKHGGEVLKFMGDGLLAIFPLAADADPRDVCRAALGAAAEVRDAVAALSEWPSA